MMTSSRPPYSLAFLELHRALVRRRIDRIDLRLRLELALLAAITAAFLFWQTRVLFDSLARNRGALAVVAAVALTWVVLALAGALLAGSRHARHLTAGTGGPAWLALPLPPGALLRHLEWEARAHALWVVPVAPGILAAMVGLVPWGWIVLLAAVFVGLLQAMSAGACAVAFRLSLTRSQPRSGLDPVTRLLVTAGRAPEAPAAARRPRWRRLPSWRAQWNKDRLLCTRPTAARRRLAVPIVLATLSVLAWALPVHPSLARFLAFALALIASGTLGEWLIALSGEDPFPVLRGLPLGVGSLWRSRATWAAIASLTLVAAHALAARPLSAQALQLFLIWAGGASLSIGILAVNYGITLFPRADVAQRLFSLALGIAIAASLMIPLLGWVTLLTAIVHSARRLPRWSRLEEAT